MILQFAYNADLWYNNLILIKRKLGDTCRVSIFSFHKLNKEKADIDDLVKRSEEFVDTAGQVYSKISSLEKENGEIDRVLLASVSMKLKTGESLKEELEHKSGEVEKQQTKMMLDQLSVIVTKELNDLKRLQISLSNLEMAQKEERLVEESETLRKLRLGVEAYTGKKS